MANAATFSVLGADVIIRGNVEASIDLHIDGTIEGDITCALLVQGESSRIEGTIQAQGARLSGTVKGTVIVRELVVLRGARVEGDVHYETLTIEPGAAIDGRLAPDAAAAKPQPAPSSAKAKPGPDGDNKPRLTLAG